MNQPLFVQSDLPKFKSIQPEKIEAELRDLMNKNRTILSDLLAKPGPYTWDNLMQPLEEMGDELSKMWSPVAHLRAVTESESLREAFNHVLPLITEYQTEISQNEALYQAISSIAASPAFQTLNAAQRKIIENNIRDFKLSGIHLPADKKKRMAELQQELSRLTTKFSENLLDATHAWTLTVTDEAQLEGLPQQARQLAIDNAKQRNIDGYVFTLDYPSYSTAIKFLKNRELRKQLYEAYVTRASDQGPNAGKWDNTPVMNDILKVRHEFAQIVGFENFVDYSLVPKMAKSPQDVLRFLNDLVARSKPIAEDEYQEILKEAAKDGLNQIEMWDLSYYSEKLQLAKFDFTQEDFRPYFPIQKVLDGMFSIMHRLYGITIQEQKDIETWHPDARFFTIHDDRGDLRGGFYIDLYARPKKRDGAWMDECRSRKRSGKQLQQPVAYLPCNFMPPVDNQSALLTHDDVLTLFHEFGHCLHHMLTKVDYPSVAGINGVAWDAVEFPSQFMENFCWEKEALALIAEHHETKAPFPPALYQKMIDAKHFQTGLQMIRQLEFSLFDFRLHLEYRGESPDFVQSTLDDVRKQVSVTRAPAFNRFQHSFAHIFAGGYAAGYYSYKWAEVLSADAYAQFEENGLFDRATGLAYMQNILEVGGSREPMASFVAFRGREPRLDALLRHQGLG